MWRSGRTELWRYRSDRVSVSPPLLIVYSLFNRSYILDLQPGNSFVEHLLNAGFDVYMLDWGIPDERDARNTLDDYIDDYRRLQSNASVRSLTTTRSTCLGTASAGCCRCSTRLAITMRRCAV